MTGRPGHRKAPLTRAAAPGTSWIDQGQRETRRRWSLVRCSWIESAGIFAPMTKEPHPSLLLRYPLPAAAGGLVVVGTFLQVVTAFNKSPDQPRLPLVTVLTAWWTTRAVFAVLAWWWTGVCIERRLSRWYHLPVSIATAVLFVVVAASYPSAVSGFPGEFSVRLRDIALTSPVTSIIIYAMFAGLRSALHYLSVAADRAKEAGELRARVAEAELAALRARLNPHFLFNSLNGISALAMQGEQNRVVAAIGQLSGLLRTAYRTRSPTTPLEDDLAFTGKYLDLQQMRLGSRLTVSLEVDPDVRRATVPAQLLQPIVENAVLHGIEPDPAGGQVAVRANRVGTRVQVVVSNSGASAIADAPLGTGLGGVTAGLEQVFGSDYRLDYQRAADGGTEVLIDVPYRLHS